MRVADGPAPSRLPGARHGTETADPGAITPDGDAGTKSSSNRHACCNTRRAADTVVVRDDRPPRSQTTACATYMRWEHAHVTHGESARTRPLAHTYAQTRANSRAARAPGPSRHVLHITRYIVPSHATHPCPSRSLTSAHRRGGITRRPRNDHTAVGHARRQTHRTQRAHTHTHARNDGTTRIRSPSDAHQRAPYGGTRPSPPPPSSWNRRTTATADHDPLPPEQYTRTLTPRIHDNARCMDELAQSMPARAVVRDERPSMRRMR